MIHLHHVGAGDLARVLAGTPGIDLQRHDSLGDAVAAAPSGGVILCPATAYPAQPTPVSDAVLAEAAQRDLRLYLEFVALPGHGAVTRDRWQRAAVADDFFGDDLPTGRLLAVQGLHVQKLPPDAGPAHLVAARVAGFDHAVYGLPAQVRPLLVSDASHPWLIAATCLSAFVTGRYAPADGWAALWRSIISWLAQAECPPLTWTPLVSPAYERDLPLPGRAEERAWRAGLRWYHTSGMLVHADDEPFLAEHADAGLAPWPPTPRRGDGSAGLLEGRMSLVQPDGSQWVSVIRRSDCICEAALALALGDDGLTASNLLDYVFHTSAARAGGRGDPAHPAYGHVAWGVTNDAWLKANYGDDNARVLLATAGTAGWLGDSRWDEAMALCLWANLRTTGGHGFRPGRIDMEALEEHGWRHYFDSDLVLLHPHYEAYLWACFLWAHERSGEILFYERAHEAIRRVVEAGPASWKWTNGLSQERARMLLPLAWLVRVRDTEEHRRWLRDTAAGLLALQDDCGAIHEELGDPALGSYPPPRSNEDYGLHEASLIQANGDPVADLLYTTNFAFLGLHEAQAATGEALYGDAADRLAAFLVRCQASSQRRPDLDGAWFRAFDTRRWEAWGCDADAGWGAWAVESGWTQGWITALLGMRRRRLSLWDLVTRTEVGAHLRAQRHLMLDD